MASNGYPGQYEKGKPITGLEIDQPEGVCIFHAGTKNENGTIVTNGGRVLGITALGSTISESIDAAYAQLPKIQFDGLYYRSDIGKKAL